MQTGKDADRPVGDAVPAGLVRVGDPPPAVLPVVDLVDTVPFPGPVMPLVLDGTQRRAAVLAAKQHGGFLLLVARRSVTSPDDPDGDAGRLLEGMLAVGRAALGGGATDADTSSPAVSAASAAPGGDGAGRDTAAPRSLGEVAPVGVLARLLRVVRTPDDRLSGLLHLVRRAQPVSLRTAGNHLTAHVIYPELTGCDADPEVQALVRQVRIKLHAFFAAHPSVSDEVKAVAAGLTGPGVLADFVAQHLGRDTAERMAFLADLDLARRMRRALEVTIRELDLLTVGNRMSREIRDKVERHQREFFLREQLRAIRTELGEEQDPARLAAQELARKLAAVPLPEAARARADEELARLQLLPAESPEHNVVRTHLEWLAMLPWGRTTPDRTDINAARAVLDADHYGLDEVKERIVEFLAVHRLRGARGGSLMCFAGPPGVGKTSLGQSIARALGRTFYRFSVGGMRDESEIKGHRRTYVGALPGRILQGLRQANAANPVFMLDELDKMGHDWRGDPASALLEVLDPAQNGAFVDHYLDVPFDLSQVMFIATANVPADIPLALRDRLEIIALPGYIPEEKREIARRYLVPRQRAEHGLRGRQLRVGVEAIEHIVTGYTREAGVRELERAIAKICRKRALDVVSGRAGAAQVRPGTLARLLGPVRNRDEHLDEALPPGIARGLAWTQVGGELLVIEAAAMRGKGCVRVTGHLEKVMQESSTLAVSYVRSAAATFGIDPDLFDRVDLHLHFPAGAIPKDGPSAGITVTAALISLLRDRPLLPGIAMTGEMTLRGEVLAVGGIREKVVAARRAGVRTVILPEANRPDVQQIPAEVVSALTFVYADTFAAVVDAAFATSPATAARPPAPASLTARHRAPHAAAGRP